MRNTLFHEAVRTGSSAAPIDERAVADAFPESAALAARTLVREIFNGYHGSVAIRMWNGETVIGGHSKPCVVVFHHPGTLRDLVLHPNLVRLAEAHLAGLVDVEGDIERLFDFVEYLKGRRFPMAERWRLLWIALSLPAAKTMVECEAVRAERALRSNSQASVAYHYDLSNDFYRLWLDPEMVYSCAYFENEAQSLADAQQDKLRFICKKLRLEPGQTLLDIGCGWGALVRVAAREFGVRAHGITLSKEQCRHAVEEIRKQGLENRATIELRDYRDIAGEDVYDRIVSVGMFEHIGLASFPAYFGAIKRLLKPNGLFLNHGITNDSGWGPDPLRAFLMKYVFPDGELTKISVVIAAMEDAGFEIIDVESLRRHYAMTLRRWIRALEKNRDRAVSHVDEKTYRVWRLYMAGAAYFFDNGKEMVYQTLAGHKGQTPVPLRRGDLYT